MKMDLSMCIFGALSLVKVLLPNSRSMVVDKEIISSVLLLSCTSCLIFHIIIIMNSPGVYLDEQGTEYVYLWSTFLNQGAPALLQTYGR